MVFIGILLIIQGFGSALAELVWDTNWGLLALAERAVDIPLWVNFAVGVGGLALIGASVKRERKS
ncbi:hypothetical protein [Amycolatopsis suaedae]|uniref:hypothetical protein n=1 Tax=Amycolatopsis suaedae TaxID=2510978 RepID=UPI00196B6336|nr:hypothetical protein [Amycolatopsis suaedae]